MRRLIVVAVALLALPSTGRAASFAEVFEATTNLHIVFGAAYLQEAPVAGARWQALITANVLGPKLGTIPCYLGGVGVDIRTVDPSFADVPGAGWSLPYLTCAPWGEQVVIQVGQSSDFTAVPGLGNSKSYYAGVGFAWSSPNQLRAKRIERQRAKEQKALLKLQDEALAARNAAAAQ